MATNSISAENISSVLVLISLAWIGPPITDISQVPMDGNGLPITKQNYTMNECQFVVTWLAGQEQDSGATGDKLTKLQAKSSDWTNTNSGMGQLSDLQKSPFNTMQQGETSQIQQDQSAVSASAQLGGSISDFDGIISSIITLIS